MTVTEGKEATLTPANIHVITDYFVDKIDDYLIVDPPTSGRLVSIDPSEKGQNSFQNANVLPAVTIFSVEDLEQQRIRVSPVPIITMGPKTLWKFFKISFLVWPKTCKEPTTIGFRQKDQTSGMFSLKLSLPSVNDIGL